MTSPSNPTQKHNLTRPWQLRRHHSRSSAFSESTIAEASITRDLEQNEGERGESDWSNEDGSDSDLESLRQVTSNPDVSLVGSYRQASLAGAGSRAQMGTAALDTGHIPTRRERMRARKEERRLLRDNNVIPTKKSGESLGRRISRQVFRPTDPGTLPEDEESCNQSAEIEPLLGGKNQVDQEDRIDQKWEEAVLQGRIHTSWRRESKMLARSSAPLIATFLLQYSLTVVSIFTIGHLGTVELAAVSLASMTANITCYAAFYGLATCLDTLCAQAYGSGKKKLVGLQLQRVSTSP